MAGAGLLIEYSQDAVALKARSPGRLVVYNPDVTSCFQMSHKRNSLHLSVWNACEQSRLLIIGSQVRALVRPPNFFKQLADIRAEQKVVARPLAWPRGATKP
jgi:hypothetical protein